MKNIILILAMCFSLQAFSQKENEFTENEINRIMDTSYVFFIANNGVYSKNYETKNKEVVDAVRCLENSNLTKKNINSAFNYLSEWWNYDHEYSKSKPNKNNLDKSIQKLLSTKNEYSKIIDAIIVIHSEIYDDKYSKSEKSNLFVKNARIIGMPENKIPLNNPFSDDYDVFGDADDVMPMGYENIQLDIKDKQLEIQLQKELARLQRLQKKSKENQNVLFIEALRQMKLFLDDVKVHSYAIKLNLEFFCVRASRYSICQVISCRSKTDSELPA